NDRPALGCGIRTRKIERIALVRLIDSDYFRDDRSERKGNRIRIGSSALLCRGRDMRCQNDQKERSQFQHASTIDAPGGAWIRAFCTARPVPPFCLPEAAG